MPSVPGPHTGILREENLALRYILGYLLETLRQNTYEIPTMAPYLQGTRMLDIMLVSVDVDTGGGYETISPGQSFHIGISVLDTRTLADAQMDPRSAINSYQFINKWSKPCKSASRSFFFGETELIDLDALPGWLFRLTQDRAYVLVGHGMGEDIKFLNNLDPEMIKRAAYVLDTVKAAQHPLGLYYRYSVEKLLDEFGIGYAKLHVAGNDAHFTLRILLMIAVRDGRIGGASTAEGELFCKLEGIARAEFVFPVLVEKPVPQMREMKVGVKADGRMRRARREVREMGRELPFAACDDEDEGYASDATTLTSVG